MLVKSERHRGGGAEKCDGGSGRDAADLLGDGLGQLGAGGAGVAGENSVAAARNVHFRVAERQRRRVGPQTLVTSQTPRRHVYLELGLFAKQQI